MYFTVRSWCFLGIIFLVYSLQSEASPRRPFKENTEDSLVLLHVLFRHGDRTPEISERYPNDPYLNFTYFPLGNGQLTSPGKRREYRIGKALRETYGDFLGKNFYPAIYDAWTTNYNRTKASLELVLASLFRPQTKEERWSLSLDWQPVPYNYNPRDKDPVLLGPNCPNYASIYKEVKYSAELQSRYDENKEVFDYISKNSGLNVTSFEEVYDVYFGLSTESEWGFELPSWLDSIWPDTIINLAAQQYYVQTETPELNAMASGYLVKRIINDTQRKIDDADDEAKIYFYSAHESNIGPLLIYLGVYSDLHIPPYGSYVVFEVHNIGGVYGFKIYYQRYVTAEPVLLLVPGCNDGFCPLNTFNSIFKDLIPSDDLCGI